MAYETERGNLITLANSISGYLGPAFVQASQGLALVFKELLGDSMQVTFPKLGYLVAEDVAESTNYTYSASSELTETSVALTAVKQVQGSKLTVEAKRFGGPRANVPFLVEQHKTAHARLFDTKLKTLFSSIATATTAGTILTIDNFIDARYAVVSAMKEAFSGKLVSMIDYKGATEIEKEITHTTASMFANMEELGVLGQPKAPTGFVGNLAGVDIYQTDGLPLANSNTDDVGCVWDPMHCFAALIDPQGFNVVLNGPRADNGISDEQLSWIFTKVGEVNDLAGCRLLSDT